MARGPQLRSAPLALPSVRDATRCGIFTCSFNSQLRFLHLWISAPPPPLLPSPAVSRDTKHLGSAAGSGSSALALQTFHIQLLTQCSRFALSGSASPLSGGLPASGRPRFSKIAVHASFTQLQPLLPTSPAGRCATRGPGACGALLPANGSLFGLARRLPLASKVRSARRAWSAETIHAISSVHNDIKGKSYAIPSFPEDAVLCPFHPFFKECCITTHVFSVLCISALWFLLQSSSSLVLCGYDVPT